MGETEIEITKAPIEKGEVELNFNSVESLRRRIVPLAK
jgi:hypothetical protein